MPLNPSKTQLIVRADDIGCAHSANLACIDSYRHGIMRSVELMVPCAWFPEAARLLCAHPGLDVGIHCCLTSEWSNMKWRPLTMAKTITDKDGFFFPMIYPNPNFPPGSSIMEQAWDLDEIEREIRAQVEMGLRHVPHASHMTCHMGCSRWDDRVAAVFRAIADQFGLWISPPEMGCQSFRGYHEAGSLEERESAFIAALDDLRPGLWMFVDHPAYDTPEMRAIHHPGYENVAADRDACTRVFTSPQVLAAIQDRGVELVSYRDLA